MPTQVEQTAKELDVLKIAASNSMKITLAKESKKRAECRQLETMKWQEKVLEIIIIIKVW